MFVPSSKSKDLQARLAAFLNDIILPNERVYAEQLNQTGRWKIPPIMEELKSKARAAGLWNLFLPESEYGAGLTNFEYALVEIMGRSLIAAERTWLPPTRQHGPVRYGTPEQKERWHGLLNGEIRSCFAMTEPDVASSDATNIAPASCAR